MLHERRTVCDPEGADLPLLETLMRNDLCVSFGTFAVSHLVETTPAIQTSLPTPLSQPLDLVSHIACGRGPFDRRLVQRTKVANPATHFIVLFPSDMGSGRL